MYACFTLSIAGALLNDGVKRLGKIKPIPLTDLVAKFRFRYDGVYPVAA
jgi:hypothetical protein